MDPPKDLRLTWRIMPEIIIDATIRKWLSTCDELHGDHCKNVQYNLKDNEYFIKLPYTRPLWLVDVVDECLVPAKPNDRYFALSYVWATRSSSRQQLQTLQSNLSYLQKRNAFSDHREIPETIRHAIGLTRCLDIRFLWVDRFCIVQDDEEAKGEQIRNMSHIYTNAYATIVAGDSPDCGLRGIKGVSPARPDIYSSRAGITYSRRDSAADRICRQHYQLIRESIWSRRAWTLQESLFSHRAIYFFPHAVTWACHCEIWADFDDRTEQPSYQCSNRFSTRLEGLQHSPWPNLEEYARIVSDYSTRRITYIDDTLPAFTGISNHLSATFAGGFLYGLPTLFLDIALLWRPQAKINRKVVPLAAKRDMSSLPSWSWAGWNFEDNAVDLTLWRRSCNYLQPLTIGRNTTSKLSLPNETQIIGTVKWSIISEQDEYRPIPKILEKYRQYAQCDDKPLPPGWTRDGNSFCHNWESSTKFKYPIPMEGPLAYKLLEPRINWANPTTAPLLSFATSRCWLPVQHYCKKGPAPNQLAVGHIYARDGTWAGHFRSHDHRLSLSDSSKGEKLEFIAISQGIERGLSSIFDEDFIQHHRERDRSIEFVNVLWIERRDGVAYRRALGHIVRNIWETQPKDVVDVVLG